MKDSVTFHCAFEDDEGLYVDPKELTEDEAIAVAVVRNKAERDRLKGKKPDAVWFVVEATTSYRVVARPETGTKKVVRRRPMKKK